MEIHNLLQIITVIISFWLIVFGIGMIADTFKTRAEIKRLKEKIEIKKEILRELKEGLEKYKESIKG